MSNKFTILSIQALYTDRQSNHHIQIETQLHTHTVIKSYTQLLSLHSSLQYHAQCTDHSIDQTPKIPVNVAGREISADLNEYFRRIISSCSHQTQKQLIFAFFVRNDGQCGVNQVAEKRKLTQSSPCISKDLPQIPTDVPIDVPAVIKIPDSLKPTFQPTFQEFVSNLADSLGVNTIGMDLGIGDSNSRRDTVIDVSSQSIDSNLHSLSRNYYDSRQIQGQNDSIESREIQGQNDSIESREIQGQKDSIESRAQSKTNIMCIDTHSSTKKADIPVRVSSAKDSLYAINSSAISNVKSLNISVQKPSLFDISISSSSPDDFPGKSLSVQEKLKQSQIRKEDIVKYHDFQSLRCAKSANDILDVLSIYSNDEFRISNTFQMPPFDVSVSDNEGEQLKSLSLDRNITLNLVPSRAASRKWSAKGYSEITKVNYCLPNNKQLPDILVTQGDKSPLIDDAKCSEDENVIIRISKAPRSPILLFHTNLDSNREDIAADRLTTLDESTKEGQTSNNTVNESITGHSKVKFEENIELDLDKVAGMLLIRLIAPNYTPIYCEVAKEIKFDLLVEQIGLTLLENVSKRNKKDGEVFVVNEKLLISFRTSGLIMTPIRNQNEWTIYTTGKSRLEKLTLFISHLTSY